MKVRVCYLNKSVINIEKRQYAYQIDNSPLYPRPNGIRNEYVGYGMVDAYAAVQVAQAILVPFDLYVRDADDDTGIILNTSVFPSGIYVVTLICDGKIATQHF